MNYSNALAARVLKTFENAGAVSPDQVNQGGLDDASERLEALISSDLIQEAAVQTAISRLYGIVKAQPSNVIIDTEAASQLTESQLDRWGVIPLRDEQGQVFNGIVDPEVFAENPDGESELLQQRTAVLLTGSDFNALRSDPVLLDALKPSDVKSARIEFSGQFRVGDDSMIVEYCNQILTRAIDAGASDIHIEKFRERAQLRFRIDGVLESISGTEQYLWTHYDAVVARMKILAGCDISEKRLAQDGALMITTAQEEDVDFRFNTVPAKFGERMVLRILAGNPALSLDKLGFTDRDFTAIQSVLDSPQGMALVTGPTGSGKTTTLYAMLQAINANQRNILTAEDPVEYYLEGAGQVQVNERIGLSFADVLRAFLRQDPDVILVGEIRDSETVEIAVKAALTGHLMLSTLHTNDAIATISRLVNLGVPHHMIAASLSLVMAQRLARRNCEKCREPDPAATEQLLAQVGLVDDTVSAMVGRGCDACNHTGFKGRRGLYEVLVPNESLIAGILQQLSAVELRRIAVQSGFKSMQDMGRDLIRSGDLALSEFTRILQMNE